MVRRRGRTAPIGGDRRSWGGSPLRACASGGESGRIPIPPMHFSPSDAAPLEGCHAVHAVLHAVVDGEADALSIARTEAHAAGCGACAGLLALARARRARLQRIGERTHAPETLRTRVHGILQAVRGSRTR